MIKLPGYGRTLLQDVDASQAIGSPSITFIHPTNTSQSSPDLRRPFGSNSPFDSSLALTILVLLTALFFMTFFSLYIRRYSAEATTRRQAPPPVPPPSRTAKCRGLDPSAVRSLPLVSYDGDAKHWSECSICLSEFEERETVKMIPYCRHGFHPVCIDTWLSSHVSCPLCRCTQLFPAVDEVRLGVAVTDQDSDRTVDNAR